MNSNLSVARLVYFFSGSILKQQDRFVCRQILWLLIATGISGLATFLYSLGLTSLVGGYLFAFALLGLFRPSYLLAVFLFLIALKHRDFTYVSLSIGPLPLYLSEWILFILLAAALPRTKNVVRNYPLPALLIALFFCVGFVFFLFSLYKWNIVDSLRHFAIVYYSLFALTVFAHIRTKRDFGIIILGLILGTLPNLLGELANFLYGTLPVTSEQKNYSMRNSFYFTLCFGLLLPFISDDKKRVNPLPAVYCLLVAVDVLLYSYSKTAMIAMLILLVLYFVLEGARLPRLIKAVGVMVLVLPFLFTPAEKVYSFSNLISYSTYEEESRILLDISAIRDFTEYPYGIGFGPPIFGDHGTAMIENHRIFHDLHNSYLSLLRRTGLEGGILFILIVGASLTFALKNSRKPNTHPMSKNMLNGLLLGWVSVFIYPFAHVVLEGPFFGSVFWIITALLYVFPSNFSNKEIGSSPYRVGKY